ncbi:MAG: dihydroneopterin aldolase [Myxococcota bacterium]|nr:dihydroneopterin aldolase [Myxococcota bacterium]
MTRSADTIHIRDLTVACMVGIYPSERVRKQKVVLNIALSVDIREAALGGINYTVDYARLSGELRFLLEASRFDLLEEAAEGIARYVLAPPTADCARVQVQAVSLDISKPEALDGRAKPSIEIYREVQDYEFEIEEAIFGFVDVIFETKKVGVYRLRVAPGAEIPVHYHKEMDEAELTLGAGLLVQGHPALPGEGRFWPRGFPHTYQNTSTEECTILCVDRPKFIRKDEIATDISPRDLELIRVRTYYPAES